MMTTQLKILIPREEKEFSLEEPLSISVKDVKQNLCRLLNTPVQAMRLEVEDDELIDEDTLEQLGALVGGEMEIKMSIDLGLATCLGLTLNLSQSLA